MTDFQENAAQETVSKVEINGITVTLIFAPEKNREIPFAVRDILKHSYLQRQSA